MMHDCVHCKCTPQPSAKSNLALYDEDFHNYMSKYFTDKGLKCPMECGYITPHGKKNHQLLVTHYLSCSRQSFECAVPLCTNICRPDVLYLFKCGHGFFCMTCLFYQEAQGTLLPEIMCDFYQVPFDKPVRRPCAKLCFIDWCNETELVKCEPKCIQILENRERIAKKFLKDESERQHVDNAITADRLSKKQAAELRAQEVMRKAIEERKLKNDQLVAARRIRRAILTDEVAQVAEQRLKLAKVDSILEGKLEKLAVIKDLHGDENNEIQEVIDETMEMRLRHRDTEAPVTTFQHVFRSEQYLVNGNGLPANSDYRFDPVNDQQRFYDDPVFEQFPPISTQDYDVRTDGIYRQ